MHNRPIQLLVLFAIFLIFSKISFAEMTIEKLIFDETKPFHLKLLDAIPKEAKIEFGNEDAENVVIEFMDYFCGYCKKIHPELIQLTNERDDLKVVFLHHPILHPTSTLLAKMVIAASYQDKGFELHHAIFSIQGQITQAKLQEAAKKIELNEPMLQIDLGREEIDKMIQLSSFLAGGAGARGTPAIFINEEFFAGYVPKEKINRILK